LPEFVECQFEQIAEGVIQCQVCKTKRETQEAPEKYHRKCGLDPKQKSTGVAAPVDEKCCSRAISPATIAAGFVGSMVTWAKSGFALSEKASERLQICQGCDELKNGRCQVCQCFVAAKVKLATEKCPLGKW
jgi:hypothetical protein